VRMGSRRSELSAGAFLFEGALSTDEAISALHGRHLIAMRGLPVKIRPCSFFASRFVNRGSPSSVSSRLSFRNDAQAFGLSSSIVHCSPLSTFSCLALDFFVPGLLIALYVLRCTFCVLDRSLRSPFDERDSDRIDEHDSDQRKRDYRDRMHASGCALRTASWLASRLDVSNALSIPVTV